MTVQTTQGAPPVGQPKPTGLAIAGMVLGIVGCIPCFSFLAIASAIVGIVLSAIALQKVKEGTGGGKEMATAGLVCGIVGLAIIVLLMLIWGAFVFSFAEAIKHNPPPRWR